MTTYCINFTALPRLRDDLQRHGFAVFDLDGSGIVDQESLFQEMIKSFPMGCALPREEALAKAGQEWQFPTNWDAFADFVSEGISERTESRIALVWLAVEQVVKSNLTLLCHALEVLWSAFKDTSALTESTYREFRIFLVGEGAGFPVDPEPGPSPFPWQRS